MSWVSGAELASSTILAALYVLLGVAAAVAKWGNTHPRTPMLQTFCLVLLLGSVLRAVYLGYVPATVRAYLFYRTPRGRDPCPAWQRPGFRVRRFIHARGEPKPVLPHLVRLRGVCLLPRVYFTVVSTLRDAAALLPRACGLIRRANLLLQFLIFAAANVAFLVVYVLIVYFWSSVRL